MLLDYPSPLLDRLSPTLQSTVAVSTLSARVKWNSQFFTFSQVGRLNLGSYNSPSKWKLGVGHRGRRGSGGHHIPQLEDLGRGITLGGRGVSEVR